MTNQPNTAASLRFHAPLILACELAVLAIMAFLGPAASLAAADANAPSILITNSPAAGAGSDSHGTIEGAASGVNRDEVYVVIYARTNVWYVQPLIASPYAVLDSNNRFSTWTHLGYEYGALLVKRSYQPPNTFSDFPSAGGDILAVAKVPPDTIITPTASPSSTPTATPTLTPSATPIPSSTLTPSSTPIPSSTLTPSSTPAPSSTPIPSSTATASPSPALASITLTKTPPSGSGSNTSGAIAGSVSGVNREEVYVVLYAHTNVWYVQPLIASPYTAIDSKNQFSTWTHLGYEYGALLVKRSYSPSATLSSLPQVGGEVIAVATAPPDIKPTPTPIALRNPNPGAQSVFAWYYDYGCSAIGRGIALPRNHQGPRVWSEPQKCSCDSLCKDKYLVCATSR